jgi:hypothetical protein
MIDRNTAVARCGRGDGYLSAHKVDGVRQALEAVGHGSFTYPLISIRLKTCSRS